MAGYATCIKFRSSRGKEKGKGRSPQGATGRAGEGECRGRVGCSGGRGEVLPGGAGHRSRVGAQCLGPSREIWGSGATKNRGPKVYTSCMANKIKS